MARHAFDCAFAIGESLDTSEAHADLAMSVQPQQAGLYGPVTAAPTAGLRFVVAVNSGSLHDTSIQSLDVLRPMRMLLPLGSVNVNSCMPHGMSSIDVTFRSAVTRRRCHSSTSLVMM